jgi:hypothetical protein
MSVIDDFAALLETTEVMKQLLKSVKEEPAHLLGDICREYQNTGQPVPDYRLHLVGYLGETALKALLSLGLIRQQPRGRLSVYSYEPTTEGLEQYERLKTDGFYQN